MDMFAEFMEYKQRQWAEEKQQGVWITLALYGTFAYRVWLLPTPRLPAAGLLLYCAACAGMIAWRHSRWRASYARWREALAVLIRLAGTGFGSWAAMTRQMLETWPPAQGGGSSAMLVCLVLLIFASGGPSCLHHSLAWKMRFGLSLLVQAAIVASIMPHHASYCSVAALTTPAARSAIHKVYAVLSKLACVLPLPVSITVTPDAAAECHTVLAWAHILIGLLLPLAWEARTEAALFQRHQQLRLEAGLPAEQGLNAGIFNFIHWVVADGQGIPTGPILCVLAALTWDWCALFCVPADAR